MKPEGNKSLSSSWPFRPFIDGIIEKWEIYLLLALSVIGITLHYLGIPEEGETFEGDQDFPAYSNIFNFI